MPPSPGPEEAAPATPAAAAPSAEGDSAQENVPSALESFFAQRWVQTGVPELLFIKRASRTSDRWSSHIAFPGGRSEPDDEDSKYTAMRETWEGASMRSRHKGSLKLTMWVQRLASTWPSETGSASVSLTTGMP